LLYCLLLDDALEQHASMEKTVAKAFRVLESLARSDGPRALGDVASDCDLTKSNAHRLLQTLTELQYVRQAPESRNYEATLRVWELGTGIFSRFDIRTAAAPYLRALQEESGESVHLSIFDNGDAVYIDKLDSPQAVGAYIRVGDRVPAYCTATGRAMLAFLDERTITEAGRELQRHTDLTISRPEELTAALDDVRQLGYALTRGEWRRGVVGVAAPIRSRNGTVIAGIGAAGPEERMSDDAVDRATRATLQAAGDISRELGFAPASI
jgi:DNA-binding IclR family transcriptional regulator